MAKKAPHFVLSQGDELVWIVEGVYPNIHKATEHLIAINDSGKRVCIARVVPIAAAPKGIKK